MAAQPKARRFKAAMERIAEREGITGPTAALDWAVAQVEGGVPISKIWTILKAETGEDCVRGWTYTLLYGLAPGARDRIREARKIGAAALADEALEIADRPAATSAEVQSNRLAVDTRRWLAGVFNREEFGDSSPKVQVGIDFGELHLDALRRKSVVVTAGVPRLEAGQADYEVIDSEA